MSRPEAGGPARAAVLVAPGHYEVRSYPVPPPPLGGAILAVELAGICGTDKHVWQGHLDQYGGTAAPRRIRLPLIQGHEIVGRIAAMGSALRDFEGHPVREGDRVVVAPNIPCGTCRACRSGAPYTLCERTEDYGNTLSAADPPHLLGGWAEAMVVLPGSIFFLVPDELPSDVAVLAELMAVTVGLDRLRQGAGFPHEPFGLDDSVVVYGVGPLGLCHVMKARMMGAGTIVAVDLSATRLEMARRLGADVTLDASVTTHEQRLEAVRAATNGAGADVVVECAGVPEVVPLGLDMVRPGGAFIEAGNYSDLGEVAISPHRHLLSKGIHLLGVAGEEPGAYLPALRQLARYRERYPVDELTKERFGLAATDAAMRRSLAPESFKVLVDPARA